MQTEHFRLNGIPRQENRQAQFLAPRNACSKDGLATAPLGSGGTMRRDAIPNLRNCAVKTRNQADEGRFQPDRVNRLCISTFGPESQIAVPIPASHRQGLIQAIIPRERPWAMVGLDVVALKRRHPDRRRKRDGSRAARGDSTFIPFAPV